MREILETGRLERLEDSHANEEARAAQTLSKVWGFGAATVSNPMNRDLSEAVLRGTLTTEQIEKVRVGGGAKGWLAREQIDMARRRARIVGLSRK